MSVDCIIDFDYPSKGQSEAVFRAIRPDNAPYAHATLIGTRMTVSASAEAPLSLLHTIEDLLACVRIAEEAFNVASGCPP